MNPVYLDYAATTPVRDEVRAAMEPYATEAFGNPSSTHRWGRAAQAALDNARAETAEALGAKPSEIFFVRGGTESDNLAIIGSANAQRGRGGHPTIVTTTIEHSAVLEPAEFLESTGAATLVQLDVSPDGMLDLESLDQALGAEAATVSVMWVNNETGLELPVAEVAQRASERGAIMHTDASQALGKVSVDVAATPIDLLTATGHKIYGPKGAGILFARSGTPLAPMLRGGGQERAIRPGTEDVAGAVGLATAIRLAVEEVDALSARLAELRQELEGRLDEAVPGVRINCGDARRAPHVVSVGISGIEDGEALLMALDLEGIAVSGGSACHSGAGKGSHVIAALYGDDDPTATVRFSLGRATSSADIERAVSALTTVHGRLAPAGAGS